MAATELRLNEDEKQVLRHLRMHGPTSRTSLAMQLDASNAALTKLSRNLMLLGLIEEAEGDDKGGRGRPAVPLRIAPSGGYAVGATPHRGTIDIAVIDYAGGVIARIEEPFDDPDPRAFAVTVRRTMHKLAERHRLLGSRLLGVGIGIPGPRSSVDRERWLTVHTLLGWRDVPLHRIMQAELDFPLWPENDANSAALAEYYVGGLIDRCSTAVAILVGHGIGAGIIVDGRLLMGQMGNAGEIGMLYPNDRPRPTTLDLLSVLQAKGCEIASIADFASRTTGYQPVILEWMNRAAQQLDLLINSAIRWFDPGGLRLCGPLPRSLLVELANHLNMSKLPLTHWSDSPRVEVSTLGGAAITLGAALLPIHASASL